MKFCWTTRVYPILPLLWAAALTCSPEVLAASIATTTNHIGTTPNLLGYNAGHFFPGGNTAAWWRYSGVNGARIFISPSTIESSDDLPPVGDGVASESAFLERRAAIRTNQFNPDYINWYVFTNNYENRDLGGNNHLKVNFACGSLQNLDAEICAQMTASQSRFPIAGPDDWPNLWELWQSFYAQAFYLASRFDVRRYQMFNEPNHPNAGGLTRTNFLIRLQLASDAVQTAVADVNRLYGKSLQPLVLAPVTAGSADGSYVGWGDLVVTNRHRDVLGRLDPGFNLIQIYDYHQYNSAPATFGSSLANLRSTLSRATAPESPPLTAISEFNTRTGATYDEMTETLDYPSEYVRFGAICVHLAANGCNELYAFKFALTDNNNPNYDVQKNAMHYVDNTRSPYNVGGINKAGEVWRLFVKGSRPGGSRLLLQKDTQASSLDAQAVFDPDSRTYFLIVANNTPTATPLTLNFKAWQIPPTNNLSVEEVSETSHGALRYRQPAGDGTFFAIQPAYSFWLFSAGTRPEAPEISLLATADCEARDGNFAFSNQGSDATMAVQNDPANTSNRRVALLKFDLPSTNLTDLQSAFLSLEVAGTTNVPVQAHVYALDASGWSEATLNWLNAPNLKKNTPAGAQIAQTVVDGIGTTAHVAGQLVASETSFQTKQLDVTSLVRTTTNGVLSFLISQDPRWDTALPSLQNGDHQPGGLIIRTREAGPDAAPKLRLVFTAPLRPRPGVPVWTNALPAGEAVIRGGSYANTDQDEIVAGFLMVKAVDSSLDFCRKTYFQFNVPFETFETDTQALFTVGFQASFKQKVQLWALNQPYLSFSGNLSWNGAQANDTASNGMKTDGAYTASPIGEAVLLPQSTVQPYSFTIPRLGNYLHGTNLWLVLCGQTDAANNDGGLRLLRTNANLQVLAFFPKVPEVTETSFSPPAGISVAGVGTPNQTCRLEYRTNLVAGPWLPVLTNFCGPDGLFNFTDAVEASQPNKFYRVVQP